VPRARILDFSRVQHHVSIKVNRDWIWQKDPLPEGYDLTGSSLTYGNLLRQELERRYPKFIFIVEIHPASPEGSLIVPVRVDFSDNFPNSKRMFDEVVRLSRDIAMHHRDRFLITKDSDEYQALVEQLEPKPVKKIRHLKPRQRDPRIQRKV
jgi:hypothetical protein